MITNSKKYFSWVKQVRIEEWCSISIFFALGAVNVLFFYDNKFSPIDSVKIIIRYFTFDNPFYGLFIFGIYLVFLWKFWRYVVIQVFNFLTRQSVKVHHRRQVFLSILEPVRLILPFGISFAPLSILLTNIDYTLRFKGMDLLFWKGDAVLFKVPPFISLSSLVSSTFIGKIFFYAYASLSFTMGAVLILLFLFHRAKLFRHAVLSFMISLTIAFPFFYLMPCQDPYHYFIQNLRHNDLPFQVRTALSSYQPSQFITQASEKIGQAETDATHDNSVPVSCFPSTHAIFSILIVYYFAYLWLPSLFISIPWLIMLLFGGVLLAQHYFVDYLVAMPVALISLFISSRLLSRFGHWGKEGISSEFSKEL